MVETGSTRNPDGWKGIGDSSEVNR